jgi:hypothetical protein
VKLPNYDCATIEPTKLIEYLLNIHHLRNGIKARLLLQFGYGAHNWQQLEADIRQYHLQAEIDRVRDTPYSKCYEIYATLRTPIGKPLRVRSIWQISFGQTIPRFTTLVPD